MIEEVNNAVPLLEKAVKHLEEEKISAALFDLIVYARMRGKEEEVIKFKNLLFDNQLRRKIGFLDSLKINPDTAIEYYDDDKDDDPYEYDAELERKIIEIKDTAAIFISTSLKEEEGISLEEFLKDF